MLAVEDCVPVSTVVFNCVFTSATSPVGFVSVNLIFPLARHRVIVVSEFAKVHSVCIAVVLLAEIFGISLDATTVASRLGK